MARIAKRLSTTVLVCVLAPAAILAQGPRIGGPPPEVRALFDALVEAVNSGRADTWEAFAQARFTPSLLARQSREQRAQAYRDLVDRLGTIEVERVTRQGPDAPLRMSVTGSKAAGVIVLDLESGSPPLIAAFRPEPAAPATGDPDRAPAPPIDSTLAAPEIDRHLDAYFAKLTADGAFSGVGLVAKNGVPVADHVFARAGMTSTGYPRSDRPAPDIALGYTRRGRDGGLRSNVDMHGVAGSAAGGGYSTALDLLTYVKAVRAGRFPGINPEIGIGGGAPGVNAIVEARGEWTVIVLANLDPPAASRVGIAIADALER